MLVGEDQEPRYVGRTRRPLEDRLSSHRRARRARWLEECNAELAAWLQANVPAVIPLEEIPADGNEWEREKAWIRKLAEEGPLYNKMGNPFRSPGRRGGAVPSAAAA